MRYPGSYVFKVTLFDFRTAVRITKETRHSMHEEYQPGYNWEDMIDKEFKKSIPWNDFDDSSEDPDMTFDREESEP